MIFTSLGPDAALFRALTPRWAFAPESGEGAARQGGRFNRVGVPARYLALSLEAAAAEYQAEFPYFPPATIATFLVTASRVVDFTGGYAPNHWSPIWAEAYCNWKGLAFEDDIEPPSWVIGDLVRESGAAGMLYRSARDSRHVCLVLYPEFPDRFQAPVHDPQRALPRDQSSWTEP